MMLDGAMKCTVFCDFDGTIVTIDTCDHLLQTYVAEDLSRYDALLASGAITLEECLTQQLSKLHVPPQDMLDELDQVIVIRPYFLDLIDYCRVNAIPFTIVSAGLDFVITHVLAKAGVKDHVPIYAPHTQFTDRTLQVTFPPLTDPTSLDFKQACVKDHQRRGYTVFYIGDAESDFNAVRQANYSFVIQGTTLAQLCTTEKIPHLLIDDFRRTVVYDREDSTPPYRRLPHGH
ncbi:MAG: MtnX-like HAD-IB family phosphatase [Candidatus Hermodarchaeia archaeon]|jgi:2,3-diketo-5-methylthio-1-phosphopentane phosphatase